jgi:hypothetical protein
MRTPRPDGEESKVAGLDNKAAGEIGSPSQRQVLVCGRPEPTVCRNSLQDVGVFSKTRNRMIYWTHLAFAEPYAIPELVEKSYTCDCAGSTMAKKSAEPLCAVRAA